MERSLASQELDRPRLERFLVTEGSLLPEAVAVRVTDADGHVILGNASGDPSASLADRPYFLYLRGHPRMGLYASKPVLGIFVKRWVIVFARRYDRPDGTFGGVVIAPVVIEHFQKALEGFDAGPGGMLTLRDSDGGFVARQPVIVKGQTLAIGDQNISPELRDFITSGVPRMTYDARAPFDQTQRKLTCRRLEAAPLFVVASLAEEHYLAEWRRGRVRTLLLLAGLLLGAWSLEALLWRSWRAHETSRMELDRFFTLVPDLVCIASIDGHFKKLNLAWEHTLGFTESELLSAPIESLIHPEDVEPTRQEVARQFASGQTLRYVNRYRTSTGGYRLLEWAASPATGGSLLFAVARDITERAQLEEERCKLEAQVSKAQRMESLGSLAGGVAHDMNNVLGAILSLASVEQSQALEGSSLRTNMDTITKACLRGRTLVQGLLGFARQKLAEEKLLDLNALVREEVALLEHTTLQRVRLEMDLAEPLLPVLGDPAALSHALMNLCVNAVDAMPAGGTLTLRTCNQGSSQVLLEVTDTGCGMAKEVLEKALDPFFTTKPVGKGTGLGLPIVYGAVKSHGGRLDMRSTPGLGTTVSVLLPASEAAPDIPEPVHRTQPNALALKVLLVDDDALIRQSMGSLLEALGHQPVVVSLGEEALSSLESGLDCDVVILDLNMPGLGGAATLPRIRDLRPELPVLLATGRADQDALDLIAAHPLVTLLAKPFGMNELRQHLNEIGRK